MSNIEVKD